MGRGAEIALGLGVLLLIGAPAGLVGAAHLQHRRGGELLAKARSRHRRLDYAGALETFELLLGDVSTNSRPLVLAERALTRWGLGGLAGAEADRAARSSSWHGPPPRADLA